MDAVLDDFITTVAAFCDHCEDEEVTMEQVRNCTRQLKTKAEEVVNGKVS